METIRQGAGASFTLSVRQDGAAFSLSDSSATLSIRNASGTVLLTQSLVVNVFGVATLEDGLTLGPDGAAAGVILQEISEVDSLLLPVGVLSWVLEIVDSTGHPGYPLWGQYNVVSPTYMVGLSGPHLTERGELRRRVAQRLGDYDYLRTTSDSDSSHLIDTLNISGATETYNGRWIVVQDGPNAGHQARVQSTSEATNTIAITPAAPYPFTASTAIDVFNTRSRGWAVWEYDNAIAYALDDAQGLSKAVYVADILPVFDENSPRFTIPDVFSAIYDVGWVDPRYGSFIPMPRGPVNGWKVQATTTGGPSVAISPVYARSADGGYLRVYGYGRHAPLNADTDATSVKPEWIITRAAYHLCVNGINREQARGNLVLLLKDEAKEMETQIRTMPKAGTQAVR